MRDLLVVSNGNGEDSIACRIVDALATVSDPPLTIDAWPMVGDGADYARRGLSFVGPLNQLPSGGFATLSLRLMIRDLAAGWIRTHARQFSAARALRGRYRAILAVGDIVTIAAAVLARTPFLFVGCAKSAYYSRLHAYTGLEKRLLRRHCRLTFPRDALTVEELALARVKTAYLGNPMMDGLEGTGDRLGFGDGDRVIALLAGSRADAVQNSIDMLALAGATAGTVDPSLRFVFASHPGFDIGDFVTRIAHGAAAGWSVTERAAEPGAQGIVLRLAGPAGAQVAVAKGRFADVLRRAQLVVGMAGTACEQAIGLGVPLIAVPSSGVQGERYVAMKKVFYGDAAVTVERDPAKVATTIGALLGDPARCRLMAEEGRARMGEPGASRAIALEVLAAIRG